MLVFNIGGLLVPHPDSRLKYDPLLAVWGAYSVYQTINKCQIFLQYGIFSFQVLHFCTFLYFNTVLHNTTEY
jgi:hypothetical protein